MDQEFEVFSRFFAIFLVYFQELKDLLVPVIEKMIRGELTDEELKRELAEAEKKQDPGISTI